MPIFMGKRSTARAKTGELEAEVDKSDPTSVTFPRPVAREELMQIMRYVVAGEDKPTQIQLSYDTHYINSSTRKAFSLAILGIIIGFFGWYIYVHASDFGALGH